MMIAADLQRGDDDAIEEAVIAAWRLAGEELNVTDQPPDCLVQARRDVRLGVPTGAGHERDRDLVDSVLRRVRAW